MIGTASLRRRPKCLTSLRTPNRQLLFTANRFRPVAKTAWGNLGVSRRASSEAGDNDSGHLNTSPNQGIFFFDNVFPLKLQWLARVPFLNIDQFIPDLLKRVDNPGIAAADPKRIVQRALPDTLPLEVTEVLPRVREGGAFVKFSHNENITPQDLEMKLAEFLKNKPIKPWFNPLRRVRAFLVQGRPWIEDLYRSPSSRLRVEFLPTTPETSAAELNQETLYSLFRKYGTLAEITPQPSDSKIVPRYAFLDFTRIRFAIMAKNCMHGFVLVEGQGGGKSGTVIKLTFEAKRKAHWIRDWLVNHPRFVIPAGAALIAAITVAVFDPIRTFFVKMHITHAFRLDGNPIWQWFRGQLNRGIDILKLGRRKQNDDGFGVVWEDRQGSIDQLRTWLIETADTFIVVQGPRGAGKKELVVDQALKNRQYKLVIDCKPIQEARGDTATIGAAAAEVGYKPVFSWMNSISSLVDLAAQGTIGTKTSFSETLDTQLAKIWTNTATALKQIALSARTSDDKDASLSDDEYLEAHPERRPVVIIDNFLHKSNESSLVYDKLADWAAALTTTNVAHVIFLTTDVSFSKSLSKALPDRVFRQITLGDFKPEVAKKFVIKHIDSDSDDVPEGEPKILPSQMRSDLDELDGVIDTLGGRLTDLEFLARRIKTGESPNSAVAQIIEQSASEILKMYLLDVDVAARKWTAQQAWFIIKELAEKGVLRYNELLLSDIYKDGGEKTLQALEQAELISIASSNGRPNAVKPGKPVYHAAFKYLTEDQVLRSRLDLAILTQLTGIENKNVDKYENELRLLAELPGQPIELVPRIHWLLSKANASHAKVLKYEQESAILKKILMEQY